MNELIFRTGARAVGGGSPVVSAYQPVKPENVLLVVNTNDVDAPTMAAYYKTARAIPDANVLNFPLTWVPADGDRPTDAEQTALLNAICDKLDSIPTLTTVCPVGAFPVRPSTEFETDVGLGANQVSIVHIFAKPFLARDKRTIGRYELGYLPYNSIHGIMPVDLVPSYLPDAFESIGSERDHPLDSGIVQWEQGKVYAAGDQVWTAATLPYWRVLTCETPGTSGTTEPTAYVGQSIGDGSVVWGALEYKSTRTYPPSFKLPTDHYSRQRALGDDYNGSWKNRLAYMVTFLDAPYVGANDPTFANRQALFEHMIDSSIATENAGFSELRGVVVMDGAVTQFDTVGAYFSLSARGFKGPVYHQNLSNEQQYFSEYTLPTTNNFPAGANEVSPSDSGTFVNIENVAFHSMGGRAYFSGRRSIKPDEINYAPGAIVNVGQSCGANPPTWGSIDTVFDPIDILSSANGSGTERNTFNTYAHINVPHPTGPTRFGFALSYVGAGATATLTVPVDNQIVLRVDDIVVATIDLTNGPWIDHRDAILAALPAGWDVYEACANYESRAVRALRNGAAVAIAALLEPGANNTSTTNLLECFYAGGTLANAMMAYISKPMRQGAASGNDAEPIFYGDPLYQPFSGVNDA